MDHDIYTMRYGLGDVIGTGWRLYRTLFRSILPIILIVYIPINIGISFISVDDLVDEHGWTGIRIYMRLIQLSELLIGVLATISLATLIERAIDGEPIPWTTALRHALSRWGASIGTGVLCGLIVFGLCLLLIVPGIIWSIYYSLFIYAVALRGLSGKEALDYSKAIVKGQWGRVFGYMFVIEVIAGLAGAAITLPFSLAPDSRLLDVISNTIIDIVSALSICMTTVFFLNNDRTHARTMQSSIPATRGTPPVAGGAPGFAIP